MMRIRYVCVAMLIAASALPRTSAQTPIAAALQPTINGTACSQWQIGSAGPNWEGRLLVQRAVQSSNIESGHRGSDGTDQCAGLSMCPGSDSGMVPVYRDGIQSTLAATAPLHIPMVG